MVIHLLGHMQEQGDGFVGIPFRNPKTSKHWSSEEPGQPYKENFCIFSLSSGLKFPHAACSNRTYTQISKGFVNGKDGSATYGIVLLDCEYASKTIRFIASERLGYDITLISKVSN
ncbi:hypothetical protein WAI453_013400 [Rhynchosporium graminicola]